jgi:NAD/NADP transhydrogenase alpha subunit
MDALTSQSALAGYYAVQLGATHMGRILPKITTAAGAIWPAKVLVMGLGVAGLEHRLGAVVEGYDVRPETEEQAQSLGATFVNTGIDARGKGGYARELTPDEKTKVAGMLTAHIQQSDLVITTAAIPGRPSPKFISSQQVAGMTMVVGAAGILLTLLMAKAMNRSVANVLFTNSARPRSTSRPTSRAVCVQPKRPMPGRSCAMPNR